MPYASRTGGPNLEALRKAKWRLIINAAADHRDEGMPYAIDNGAWTAFSKGLPWDEDRFRRVVETHGARADFVVVPDIVTGGLASLKFTERWLPKLEHLALRLIAVQDGMAPWDVAPFLGRGIGLFVGGSTEWKWASLPHWGFLARRTGSYLHVGRVNTTRRILECIRVGAHSFDGSSPARFGKNLLKLDHARQQLALCGDGKDDE